MPKKNILSIIAKPNLFIESLRKTFHYHEDGHLIRKSGKVAGSIDKNGRLRIMFRYKMYSGPRLIWAVFYGNLPEKDIDHKDRNPSNNKIENLREASMSMNMGNYTKRKKSKYPKGVSLADQKLGFRARLKINQREIHIGTFPTIEEASAAYQKKHKEIFGEFSPY